MALPYPPDAILTPEDVARELGVDVAAVRSAVRRGDVRACYPNSRIAGVLFLAKQLTPEACEVIRREERRMALAASQRTRRVPKDEPQFPPLRGGGRRRYLYVMHNPRTGLTKIGIAFDVDERRRSLEYASGCPITVLAAHEGTAARVSIAEMELHERYAAHRAIGEWFDLPTDVVNALVSESAEEVRRG